MGRNERVNNKHYCDICRIWIENHPNNIRAHQEGGRHRYNQRKYFKSESYKEAQNKKRQDEIQEELQKMSGGATKVGEGVRKSIQKPRINQNIKFKNNAFIPQNSIDSTQSRDRLETHDKRCCSREICNINNYLGYSHASENSSKSQEARIGEWEEVKRGESVFNGDTSDEYIKNPFISYNNDKGIEIRNNTVSMFNSGFIGSDEYEGFHLNNNLNYDSKEGSKQKIQVKFNSRKLPSQSFRSL
ncbi:U1 small nuclear ribonucleoprotein c like finger [Cryptosporidium xiaoi]|uniref:U1 small nuclear ribonucleoprotein c like finger n=1 Tax=Cryptosporidium xiaoi TaxID=659607 RepID=A0AAV9Y2V8_9CRYT